MKSSTSFHRAIQGFNLVELLAVIAVAGILAGITLTVLGRVRESARETTCASNLRQIYTALMLYATDHRNVLPPVATEWPPASEKSVWGYAVWAYAGYTAAAFVDPNALSAKGTATVRNIFQCPSTQRDAVPLPGLAINSGYSYGLNSNPNGSNSTGWTTGVKLSRIKTPAQTAMVLETSFPLADSAGYWLWYGMIPHHGATHVLFYDGHIELRTPASITHDQTKPFWGGGN